MVFVEIAELNSEKKKMKQNHKIEKGVLYFELEGDLIGEDSGLDIIEIVNTSIADNVKYCIINIEKVRYINSSGIGVLITILTKFRNKNGEVALVSPSESVKKLLIITKLNAIFTICENIEEAREKILN